MKPYYIKLPKHLHETVHIRKGITMNFYQKWHYHDVTELVYILKGQGTRFIGDNISRFSNGDLLLVGDHLPHLWKNEPAGKGKVRRNVEALSIVIQFPAEFGAEGLLDIPEMAPVKKILDESRRGLYFKIPENHHIKRQIRKMLDATPFDRIFMLIQLLRDLAEIKEKIILSGIPFADHYQKHSSGRMDAVYNYILNHFSKEIKLEELARVANMTPTSLCRYFKHSTQKPLSAFINEVRIGYACKLLIDDKLSISEVCFRCGYNNLSYFNRQFKKIIGISPSKYQNRISENLAE